LAFSYWIDNLGFITEGRLAAVLIIPSLGVPNWSVIYIINTAPSAAHSGTSYLLIFVITLIGGPYLSFSSPPLDPIWPEWMGFVAQEQCSSTRGGLCGHSQAADLAASHANLATTLAS
jgi:hypothetical protein